MNIEAFLTLGRQKSPGFYVLSEVLGACKGGHNLVYLAAGLGGMFSIALKGSLMERVEIRCKRMLNVVQAS